MPEQNGENSTKNQLITGLAHDLIEGSVAILQYADDTVLCVDNNVDQALNLTLLLYMFELMLGLKINFLKSEVLCVGVDDFVLGTYSDMFNCQIGHFPMKYLGVPVGFSQLRCVDWELLDAKFLIKCDSW